MKVVKKIKYLKVSYFNQMNSYIRPIVGRLLLDFEPQSIKIEDSYREAMKDSAEDFFCTDEFSICSKRTQSCN